MHRQRERKQDHSSSEISTQEARKDENAKLFWVAKEEVEVTKGEVEVTKALNFSVNDGIIGPKVPNSNHNPWRLWALLQRMDRNSGAFQFSFFHRFYLFIFRERGWEGEREGEKHQCVVASHMTSAGDLARKPRHVPWWGIELATLWFTGPCSIHELRPPGTVVRFKSQKRLAEVAVIQWGSVW